MSSADLTSKGVLRSRYSNHSVVAGGRFVPSAPHRPRSVGCLLVDKADVDGRGSGRIGKGFPVVVCLALALPGSCQLVADRPGLWRIGSIHYQAGALECWTLPIENMRPARPGKSVSD